VMTRSACLIFNPVSGQNNSERDLQVICQQLEPSYQLEVYSTMPNQSVIAA
jgi:diacylglycerol kinase family enzyme